MTFREYSGTTQYMLENHSINGMPIIGPAILGKWLVVMTDFVDKDENWVKTPDKCGYAERFVDDEYKGKVKEISFILSSELFLEVKTPKKA